ncbi:cell surface glycoprotein CD200 receptor 1 isoform X3 [Loxodonta africana]|uniref:cell surface glycoprotein CD200 receptor 1 isoform X3 n=1 Tax=Loxodonta africana TaxID=9785 RepID=UPI000C8136CF|nr:cell surface glycoprotein CD200 receptor 1 isoform X3 [Loxodonta africana]
MLCIRRTSDLGLLRILTVSLVADSTVSSPAYGKQPMNSNSTPPSEAGSAQVKGMKSLKPLLAVNTRRSVLVGTKAVLACPPVPLETLIGVTWKIIFRDNTSCTKAYREDKNATVETNCTDKRITWASRANQNFSLHIDPVAITHDGNYTCEMATSNGNFHHGYHLQVLVPPKTTMHLTENGTVVCKAVAGKPAAQISWTPEGDCVTEEKNQRNGTVSVQSTCRWEEGNVSTVTCSVSHLTGNSNQSLDLHSYFRTSARPTILYTTLAILIILIIVLSIYFLKTTGCRKCKPTKTETIQVFEEDEAQPYASYTEKSNPLYDTVNKGETDLCQLKRRINLIGTQAIVGIRRRQSLLSVLQILLADIPVCEHERKSGLIDPHPDLLGFTLTSDFFKNLE